MIRLIATISGYVESSDMARLFWQVQFPWHKNKRWKTKEDVEQALAPEQALSNLVADIATEYRREFLLPLSGIKDHWQHGVNRYDLSVVNCPKCDKPIRDPFYPENFQEFLQNLTRAKASESLVLPELERWWPWGSFSELREYEPDEILLVEERFETYGVACLKPDQYFTEKESADLAEFVEGWPVKVEKNEDGFWEMKAIYTHLDEDPGEAINKVDWK